MEERFERQARNEALVREVNERKSALDRGAAGSGAVDGVATFGFHCECGRDGGCGEMIWMTLAEYEVVRAQDDRFALVPGARDRRTRACRRRRRALRDRRQGRRRRAPRRRRPARPRFGLDLDRARERAGGERCRMTAPDVPRACVVDPEIDEHEEPARSTPATTAVMSTRCTTTTTPPRSTTLRCSSSYARTS